MKILNKIYGDDILTKIISPDLDNDLLVNIENTINEINEFKKSNGFKYENIKEISDQSKKLNEYEYEYKNHDRIYYNNNYKENYNCNENLFKNKYAKITPNVKEIYENNKHNSINYRKINNNYNYNNNLNNRKENNSFYSSEALLARNNSESHHNNNNNYNNYNNNYNNNNYINTSNQNSINYSINRGNISGSGIIRTNSRNNINMNISTKHSKSKSISKSISNFDIFDTINLQDKSFENILRKYGGRQMSGKVFMNYFKKKPQFFDPPLQKGGISSLEVKDVDRLKRNNYRKTIGNYSTLSITNN
jgi:hypothetical protein